MDYERLPESGEAFIYVAMSRLMARRWPAHEAFRTVSPRTPVNRGEEEGSEWGGSEHHKRLRHQREGAEERGGFS
jgi:hypothetical protein